MSAHPALIFILSLILTWLAARAGWWIARRRIALDEPLREDYNMILTAALTLLGLTIGFTFSMATGRYDQRKNYEEAEANAIGTEYLRADMLPAADSQKVRTLLRNYTDQRIQFYETSDEKELDQINARTAELQSQLWSAVLPAEKAEPTPPMALVVSGMNDVINTQGYTQSAWWYRIPLAAWALMILIAIFCNLLVGYGSHAAARVPWLFIILPLLIATAFALIADIDSPRHGIIRVHPQNLTSLAESLKPR
jgi:hypothetical protein